MKAFIEEYGVVMIVLAVIALLASVVFYFRSHNTLGTTIEDFITELTTDLGAGADGSTGWIDDQQPTP